MFFRENEFLVAVRNIAEELLHMQHSEGVSTQAYRLLEVADQWQKSESQRSDESSFLMRFLLLRPNP